MLIVARRRLLPRTGASWWKLKANRPWHRRPLKNSAASIGDPFTALCDGRVLGPRKRRILRKIFLRFCWNAGICAPRAKRRDDCALISSDQRALHWHFPTADAGAPPH